MISRRRLLSTSATVLGTTLIAGAVPPAQAAGRGGGGAASLRVGGSTADYVRRPLGIGSARPRLGWPLSATAPGRSQSAYQIRVALSERALEHPDVWDSGKVDSPDSAQVTYGGPELRSRTRYHWTVRVWDDEGHVSAWSEPAWWETGLNEASDWSASWIGAPASLVGAPALGDASWIWFPEGDPASSAPAATRWFRGVFDVPEGVTRARLVLTADDGYVAHLDGAEIARAEADQAAETWRRPSLTDVTARLTPGRHVLAVAATNDVPGPAGLLGALELTTAEGVRTIATDGEWKAADAEPVGDWRALEYDDGAWSAAKVLAPWGSGPWGKVVPAYAPVAQLRHEFRLRRKPVERARLYSTALGLYEAHLNGKRVGTDRLAPGWTDYAKRIQYQTHDVTELLTSGANTLGVELATGWYAGNVGMFGPHQYGEHPAFLGQLEVTYRDGTTERVLSGTDWRAATGPITLADLLTGENYDARRETEGWLRPGFDDAAWERAVPTAEQVTAELVAEPDGPCRVIQQLTARKITEPRPGVFVFDLGQNMVGTARLRVTGRAGTTVRLRHAEVLNPDGTVYTTNLRSAAATDHYTLKGGGRETYEPRFTFHGFRYVEVTGYPGRPPLDAVVGQVIHTDAPLTMEFETDVPLLNQLHSNITWGLRGNFLSIPTDTPARDERLGWTGDINVFAPTAAYTMESARFLAKWLSDLQDDQTADGAFTDVAPHVEGLGAGSAGWGDAGVTVPWALHQAYGDTRVLERAWPSMLKWLDYLDAHSSGRLRPATGYGDWLNIADDTPKDVIATAYYAHSADLVARTARVLGKDPAPYTALFEEIREAFRAAYVTDGGRVKGDTQTAYVLALSMDLLSTAERVTAAGRLVALVEAKDWHLSTGFLGTPRLLPVLTDTGHTDVAYRLLLQRTFPSWGYQIDRGATTMWERWDSIKPDGSFQDAGMNSFNHYAYGSVGEWMYAHITGIAPAEPGFRKVTVRPRPGGGITRARGRFASLHGPVTTDWKTEKGRFRLTVTLPVNTTADVWIQAGRPEDVTHTGARFLRMEDGCAVFAVGSGHHRFEA